MAFAVGVVGEGRDGLGGDSFVLFHDRDGQQRDLYLHLDERDRDQVLAIQDWIAAARNDPGALIAEVRAGREGGATG